VDAGRGLFDSAVALELEARAGYCRYSSMISMTQMLCQLSILAFLFVSNQNGSKRIKLDQIGVFTNQKMLIQNVVTFTMTKKNIIIFLIKLDQNCRKWITLDQIGILPN
jgi:hypothetical protein